MFYKSWADIESVRYDVFSYLIIDRSHKKRLIKMNFITSIHLGWLSFITICLNFIFLIKSGNALKFVNLSCPEPKQSFSQ